MAAETLETLLRTRPESGKEEPGYLAAMVKSLAWLAPEEHGWLTHPRTGLQTVCPYLPQPADVHGFLRKHRERLEAVQPAPTTYRRLADETGPWDKETDFERKKRVVRELLGYNPDDAGKAAEKRIFTPPTADDLATIQFKTPAAPVSDELKAMLRDEGYPYMHDQEDAA